MREMLQAGCVFREDDSAVQKNHAPENLNILRKYALFFTLDENERQNIIA